MYVAQKRNLGSLSVSHVVSADLFFSGSILSSPYVVPSPYMMRMAGARRWAVSSSFLSSVSASNFQRVSLPFSYLRSSVASVTSASDSTAASRSAGSQASSAVWKWPRVRRCSWAARYMARYRGSQSSPASSGCWIRFIWRTSVLCLLPLRQKLAMERTLLPTSRYEADFSRERLRPWSPQCRHIARGSTTEMTPPDLCTSPPASETKPSM
mmetsp:Transcript_48500/g.134462  ORF Transcript_48500/g.134462 Transcript_48500/m.134462 type:complete len:211 (-) Transcript_48500:3239-3871(-)